MLNTCAASCHRNPGGSTAAVPTFGIAPDNTITDWRESTDLALADTLWRYWQYWGWTGVRQTGSHVPATFSLSQNFPNPFNPSTRVVLDIAARGRVLLAVYDVTGEFVTTLMDGDYAAGRYEVTWGGRDDFGLSVASGVYFCRLTVGPLSVTKKMLLVR
jgi:hypothetical protein